jgi:RHS repeat-associated protein
MRRGTTVSYLHSDHLGSTSLVTNAAGQAISQSRYTPFGESRWTSGSKATDFTYTGQRSDSFGLMDYNARYYSSVLGRFSSPDTIIPEQSQGVQAWDRFAYVNNSPVVNNDPSGHCSGGNTYGMTQQQYLASCGNSTGYGAAGAGGGTGGGTGGNGGSTPSTGSGNTTTAIVPYTPPQTAIVPYSPPVVNSINTLSPQLAQGISVSYAYNGMSASNIPIPAGWSNWGRQDYGYKGNFYPQWNSYSPSGDVIMRAKMSSPDPAFSNPVGSTQFRVNVSVSSYPELQSIANVPGMSFQYPQNSGQYWLNVVNGMFVPNSSAHTFLSETLDQLFSFFGQ